MKLTKDQETKLNELADDNSFYRSLWNQYQDTGYLTEMQVKWIKEEI
jgi:hypothetical protein